MLHLCSDMIIAVFIKLSAISLQSYHISLLVTGSDFITAFICYCHPQICLFFILDRYKAKKGVKNLDVSQPYQCHISTYMQKHLPCLPIKVIYHFTFPSITMKLSAGVFATPYPRRNRVRHDIKPTNILCEVGRFRKITQITNVS